MIKNRLAIPNHLNNYIVDQDYSRYTAIDHACWRFIMKISTDFFSKYAHSSYLSGLDATGITREYIPKISNINSKLNDINWSAVPVRGFLPPIIFMQFQAHSILPIASDMRTINHLTYTPAPDIVHEAAGHSPIIADEEYSKYLSNYGKAASKAIYSKFDHEVYMAIRHLSDIKESPLTSLDDIMKAEDELKNKISAMPFISEAAYLARLNWWTVEYGLVGDIKHPKIFGAGLLSSVGESYNAIFGDVKKIPFSLDCIKYSYDITEQQPQLFVAEDFNHLNQVLDEFINGMAFYSGGISSVQKAIDSKSISTFKLDSGIEISGIPTNIIGEEKEEFFRFTGPVQICYKGKEIEGHSGDYHNQGFSSPLCSHQIIDKISSTSDEEWVDIHFESGIKLNGRLNNKLFDKNILLIASFSDCTISKDEQILFEPSWGIFDLACGSSVISVYGGPADVQSYLKFMDVELPNLEQPIYNSPEENTDNLAYLYEQIKSMRDEKYIDRDKILDISNKIKSTYPNEWLLRYEIMEIISDFNEDIPDLYDRMKADIIRISNQDMDLRQSIQRAIQIIESPISDKNSRI